jgi:hypothetical protein
MIARRHLICFCPALFLFSMIGVSNRATAALITSFQDAFQLSMPAAGWSYLWNSGGEIGNPANYTALLPNSNGVYTSGGVDTFPAPNPAGVVNFDFVGGSPGGHPGLGSAQAGSGGIERFAIAAYTLANSELVAIQNSLVVTTNPNSGGSTDGLNVKVFLNNSATPVVSTTTLPGVGSTATFNGPLGPLNAGDTIYVAIGSRDEDLFDSFQLHYDVVSVPEPHAAATIVIGLLGWLSFRSRKHLLDMAETG